MPAGTVSNGVVVWTSAPSRPMPATLTAKPVSLWSCAPSTSTGSSVAAPSRYTRLARPAPPVPNAKICVGSRTTSSNRVRSAMRQHLSSDLQSYGYLCTKVLRVAMSWATKGESPETCRSDITPNRPRGGVNRPWRINARQLESQAAACRYEDVASVHGFTSADGHLGRSRAAPTGCQLV